MALGAAALGVASCSTPASLLGRPEGISPRSNTGPVTYRALSTIPEKPEAVPAAMREEAIESLSAERATAAEAADRLRNEPFKLPDPPPPPDPEFP